ncbi:MAG: lysine--tRNA ligase [Patescibacteria group bacterium]
MALEDIRKVRLEKLEKLKAKGINPYPARSSRTHSISDAISDFDALAASKEAITIAGRVMSLRGQGALIFFDLFDGTGRFQGLYKKDDTNAESIEFFNEVVDIGDFIEISGIVFTTKTGQKTVEVAGFRMLAKTLLPLPEKWHGLQDAEERFRKRYLDILGSEEVREMFVRKAKFWKATRDFLTDKGFLEIDTPTLEVTTGGAEATPFKTHHEDYDLDVYLRISVGELWQKRLMAAGFPKTFEIGRVYRNEGTSPNHLQEFTNAEFYWSFADFRMGMDLVKEMYRFIASNVYGKTVFTTRGHDFDLAAEWTEISYVEEIKRQTGIDAMAATEEELVDKLKELKVEYDAKTKERLVDALWKHCRKAISGPAFVINYPDFMQPLAKRGDDPATVEQFQVLIGGSEIGKGYSELNDPVDQKARFEHQQALLKKGDKEAMMADFEFIEMLEHGMPPTCGFGFGERFFAFLEDKPIREVQLFPLMKPREDNK